MFNTPVFTQPIRLAVLLTATAFTLAACGAGGSQPSINAPTAPPPKVVEPEPVNPKPQPENPQMLDGATKAKADLSKLNLTAPAAGTFLTAAAGATEMLVNNYGSGKENERTSPTVRRNGDSISHDIKAGGDGGRARLSGLRKIYYDAEGKLTGLHPGGKNMAAAMLGDYLPGKTGFNNNLAYHTTTASAQHNPLTYHDAGLAVGGAFGGIYSADLGSNSYVWRDPAVAGWNYQTFGYFVGSGSIETDKGYQSIGIPTANLPTQGGAEYKGIATGEYVDNNTAYQLSANSRVYANFAERKLNFTTDNTQRHAILPTGGLAAPQDAANLNLRGVAAWDAGKADFSGVAVSQDDSLTGKVHGRFYGPDAAEVGGVFGLQNSDKSQTLIGGFGGKRE